MSKKAKEIILIAIICIIKLLLNVLSAILILKYFDSIVSVIFGSVVMLTMCLGFFFLNTMFYIFTLPFFLFQTTYGEFPFEIVYSIDGEVFEKQGVAVCELERNFDTVYGPRLDLVMYFDKAYDNDILCTEPYEIEIDCGNARYYLDGEKSYEDYVPGEYIRYFSEGKYHKLTLEEAKEEFGIEIISAKFSEPLVNTEDEKR